MLVVALVTFGSVLLISVVLFGRSRSDALQSNMMETGYQAISKQYPAPAFRRRRWLAPTSISPTTAASRW